MFNVPKANYRSFDDRTKSVDTITTNLFENYKFPRPDCSKKLLMYACTAESRHCHGLADRQRGIISSFMMALLTNRTFVINHTWPCSLSKFLKPNLYDWSKCLPAFNNSDGKHIVTFYDGKGNLPNLATLEKGDIWTERLVTIYTNVVINKRIRLHPSVNDTIPWAVQGSREHITRKLFYILFKLEKSLKKEIDSYVSKITSNGRRILVGVHIRRDYVKQPHIEEVFNIMKKYSNKSMYSLYLSTDVDGLRLNGTRQFPNCYTLNVTDIVIHVNSNFADCKTFYAAIFEQQVLSRADILFKTRSGFSTMAYMIRPGQTLAYQFQTVYKDTYMPDVLQDL